MQIYDTDYLRTCHLRTQISSTSLQKVLKSSSYHVYRDLGVSSTQVPSNQMKDILSSHIVIPWKLVSNTMHLNERLLKRVFEDD